MRQKDVLLEELEHRIANSLQIIASIILLKAKTADLEETRLHLQDAHKRVMSVAAVQKQLHAASADGSIQMLPYLERLCQTLATSMIGISSIDFADGEWRRRRCNKPSSREFGLIATELVMNALKHAFCPPPGDIDGRITVAFDVEGTNWKLSVADNGIGRPDGVFAQPKTGLGTGIVNALAHQSVRRLKPRPILRHDRVDHARYIRGEGHSRRVNGGKRKKGRAFPLT